MNDYEYRMRGAQLSEQMWCRKMPNAFIFGETILINNGKSSNISRSRYRLDRLKTTFLETVLEKIFEIFIKVYAKT